MLFTGTLTQRRYVATAGQTDFVVDFWFGRSDDLIATRNGVVIAYTLVSSTTLGTLSTSAVVRVAASAVNDVVTITRRTQPLQRVEFPIQGAFSTALLNDELTRMWMGLQDMSRAVDDAYAGTLFLTGDNAAQAASYVQFLQAGTGAVTRSLLSKMRETVSVTDFGAIGDGATNNDAAFAAAFTAAGVGGTVIIPRAANAFRLSANVSTTGRRVVFQGSVSNALVVNDGGVNFYERSDAFSSGTPFGAGFLTQALEESYITATHNDSRVTRTISRKARGSGTNGPAYADVGLLVSVEKENRLASTVEGEIDGMMIVSSQGRKGDAAGLLINHTKVKDPATGTGGSLAIESSGSWTDSAGTAVLRIQAAMNFIEGVGGPTGNTGYGFWAEAQLGGAFSAFHADQFGSGSIWQNLITFVEARAIGSYIYRVDGTGRTYAGLGTTVLPSYCFGTDTDTGFYWAAADTIAVSTGGVGRWGWGSGGAYYPLTDNVYPMGGPASRMTVLYATTGTINTSDETEKQDIEALPDAWLDAWGDVQWARFRWKDAVAEKGTGARWHVGLVAQRVRDAFAARGLDAQAIGLLCFDRWEADEALGREAGERWGVRYEEALSLEAAYGRREIARLRAAIA